MKNFKLLLTLAIAFMTGGVFAQDVVKIGVAGPHTGPYAAFGEQLWRGALLAANDINKAGGVNGKKLVLIKADDACEPKQAVAVANRLVDQNEVAGVVGHFCSSSSIPASAIYDEAGIIQITPASTNPQFTERGLTNVFRTCGRDDQQGDVAGEWIVKKLKAKRVAFIHDKDTYGQGLADATKAKVNSLGVKEVLYEGLTRGEKDFNALVTKMKALKLDVVYFGGLHTEAGPLIRQMREQGLTAKFVSGDGIVSNDFVNAAGGPKFVENVYMTFGQDPRNIKAGRSLVKRFREMDYEPEGYTLYSYLALTMLVEALAKNDMDSEAAAKYIRSKTFDTVMGKKGWDKKGDLTISDYVMYQWKNGKYKEIN